MKDPPVGTIGIAPGAMIKKTKSRMCIIPPLGGHRQPSPQLLSAANTNPTPAKKLDNHAREPAASSPNSGKHNTKTAPWDPLARYYSDANSFPDYRAPSGKMGRGNVRNLNTYGAVNTFSKSSASDRRAHAAVTLTGPPAKRQKTEGASSGEYSTSRFFAQKPNRDATYDLTGSSQEDPYEFKSNTSSANNNKSSVYAIVPEFRNAQPQNKSTSRRLRRNRRSLPPSIYTGNSANGSIKDPASPDSPDVLAVDNDSPPPANVISDIPQQKGATKRVRQPSLSEPHVKRPRPNHQSTEPIDISEDELHAAEREDKNRAGKRRTNFSDLQSRNPKRTTSRGDICPTEFRTKKSSNASETIQEAGMGLRTAVCASNIWRSTPDHRAKLVPRRGQDGSTVRCFDLSIADHRDGKAQDDAPNVRETEFGDTIPWLKISMEKIKHVQHHGTHSTFVRIQRSTAPGAPPTLLLEFDSKEDAFRFVGCIPTNLLTQEEPEQLKKMFDVAMTKAAERISAQSVRGKADAKPRTSIVVEIPEKLPANEAEAPKKEKIKDRMLAASQQSENTTWDFTDTPDSPPARRTSGPATRRTRRSSPQLANNDRFESPDVWTLKNPDWISQWQQSLVYPATGKNRATVDAEDIKRLDEGEFLNDNIISFYLRYLQVKLGEERPEILNKVYIFSSFFFTTLKTPKTRYAGVRGWTAKVDLLSYDYIVVPVNENAHWYLAIICNVAKALPGGQGSDEKDGPQDSSSNQEQAAASPKMPAVEERVKTISLDDDPVSSSSTIKQGEKAAISSPQQPSSANQSSPAKPNSRKSIGGSVKRYDPGEPKIITLDSLGSSHSQTCKVLKEYLAEEAKDKKGIELTFNPPGMTGKGIPEQDNYCDCGIFVLGYMEEFLKDPDEASRRLLQKEHLEWDIRPSQLRNSIRNLLFTLQKEQQERLHKERESKKRAKRMKMAATSQAPSSPGATAPPTSSQEPPSRQSLAESQKPSADPACKESSEPPKKSPEPAQTFRQEKTGVLGEPEPKFISRLKDEKETLNNDEQSPETFYSAPSSPTAGKAEQSQATASKSSARGRFVERILSSGSEGQKDERKPGASIRPSIEVDDEPDPGESTKEDKSHRPSTSASYVELRDSAETDIVPVKGPSYDGIERSRS